MFSSLSDRKGQPPSRRLFLVGFDALLDLPVCILPCLLVWSPYGTGHMQRYNTLWDKFQEYQEAGYSIGQLLILGTVILFDS